MINAIAFFDKGGQRVESYEAQESDGLEESTVELAENEEIFGVYGVKDSSDHFTSFGFITKMKHSTEKPSPAKMVSDLSSPLQLSALQSPDKLLKVHKIAEVSPRSNSVMRLGDSF
mmetsp:Transcript_27227/g.36388  ORF Transcript_27227/g.36388 Transcript_27227/m.36388 type:complete len:116 (-) Transcript_27227:54-401(-)